MITKIKKSLKYIIIVAGVVIMLPTILYLLLQIPAVQTYIVKKISGHFSNELKSTISIGSVEYKFFNNLALNEILIKDKNNDTLIYSKVVTVGVRNLDFKNKSFRLGRVRLVQPVIGLITDSTGMMNLTWFLNQLKNPADTSKKSATDIRVDQINIRDGRFTLINKAGTRGKTKIDMNNVHINALDCTLANFKISNDTTSFDIHDLGFIENSGFTLYKLNSSFVLEHQNINLTSLQINLGNSIFNIPHFALTADSSTGYRNFTEKVRLNVLLNKSIISTSDLKYFLPLDSINESFSLSGRILGTISELRGRNIKLTYRDYTSLDCDFDFSGLPKIENAFLYIGVNSLKTNAKDLGQVKLPGTGYIVFPDALKKLGTVTFDGSFTGFTTDFVTYGEIRTNEGNIRTDVSLRPEKNNRYRIKGLITGSNINLGNLSGQTELLGNLSIKTNIDGYAYSLKKFEANMTGKIDSVEINKYVYRNISLNGFFTEKTWDGSINIVDKNIKLDLLGLLNFKNDLPEFDFTLNIADANLYKLHFDKLDTTSSVTLLLTSNFRGNSIDNIDGEIKLLNSKIVKFNNTLELYDFSIKTYKENNIPALSLRTDFVDADIKGPYNFASLGDLEKTTLDSLMPSHFHLKPLQKNLIRNNFVFNINFKNTDKINNFFRTGVLLADKSYLRGVIATDSAISISGKSDKLTIKNNVFNNFSFDTRISQSKMTLDLKSASVSVLGQSELKDFSVGLITNPDIFSFNVNWDNNDKILNRGSLIAHGSVTRNSSHDKNTILKIDIDSSQIYSDNNLWKLKSSTIMIDSNSFHINKLSLTSSNRYYLVDGSISENPADTLHLNFKGIDLSPVNIWLNRKKGNDPTAIPIDIKGRLDGKILLSNVYKSVLLAGDVNLNNFSILGSEFGNISIKSILNNSKKVVDIKAINNLNMFDITGQYDPSIKRIDLFADATRLPVSFLNPLLKVFASDIAGTASGKLHFSAENGTLFLQGGAMVENTSMKVTYLQTKYTLNDSVKFDKKGIHFNNVKITDARGNAAFLTGSVFHKNFKEYTADLTFTLNANSFQVLNTLPKDNPMFYGTVYAAGPTVARIKAEPTVLSFDVSAKSGKNSKLAIPLNNRLSVTENSYISFEDPHKLKDSTGNNHVQKTPVSTKTIPMEFNLNLEVTPDAEIQIIFDSKAGDIMKGHGSSPNLNVNLNKKGDFNITGDYTISDGDYTFTFGNLFNKPFSVENGGRIMFNGNLKDAEIDLKANYLNLKASLDILANQSPGEDNKYKAKQRVEPQLNLTGKLFNPIVGFDIYLPDADEETRTLLRNTISSEDEMTKQVFSLLLTQSFIPVGNNSASSSPTGTSAMAATTFEMVSSQISNWLSQISKDLDIGVLIRPGYNQLSPQEAEVAISKKILNDKVELKGNVDVRGTGSSSFAPGSALNPSTANQLTGDFDAEIKLTEKLKLKVFNRYNEFNAISGLAPYTQGVGLMYGQDFNKFRDLFRKKAKAEMKKEEETKIKAEVH